MQIESKANCPLDGFNPCRQLECAWFMKIKGKDPQSEKEIEDLIKIIDEVVGLI
jgi:hypothetical protein